MQLDLQGQTVGDVVVLRCRGRIVSGDEARQLQDEIEKLTRLTKSVVLNLGEVTYLDSGGLGSLVRILGMLRAARGDLKICQISPFVEQVLQATNLIKVFQPCASEKDAIAAFSSRVGTAQDSALPSAPRIVCLDTSPEVLAYLRILLQGSGYEVFTTRYLSDAVSLAVGTKPRLLVCGPSWHGNNAAAEKFRESAPAIQLLHLPADFSTSEADQAGRNLVDRVRSILAV